MKNVPKLYKDLIKERPGGKTMLRDQNLQEYSNIVDKNAIQELVKDLAVTKKRLAETLGELERTNSELLHFSIELDDRVAERTRQFEQAEKKYRSIFENATEGIFQLSMDGNIILTNPAFARIFGYKHPDAVKKVNIEKLISVPENGNDPGIEDFFKSITGKAIELRGKKKNGSDIWVVLKIQVVDGDELEPTIFEGTIEDITRRKNRESQKQLTAQVMSLLNDNDGDLDYLQEILKQIKLYTSADQVCLCVRKHEQIIKYGPSKTDKQIFFDDEKPPWLTSSFNEEYSDGLLPLVIAGSLLTNGSNPSTPVSVSKSSYISKLTPKKLADVLASNRIEYSASDLKTNIKKLMIVPLKDGNQMIGALILTARKAQIWSAELFAFLEELVSSIAVAIGRYLAQEKVRELNEELEVKIARRTQSLQIINNELEAFSYAVSHDLRAPLRHIKGFANQLKSTINEYDLDSAGFLEKITQSVERMGDMIEHLLRLSHLGRAQLTTKRVDLLNMIREEIAQFQEETKNRIIEWVIAPMPVIRADEKLLRHVFMNLISNALKYTRDNEKTRIEVGCNDEKNHIEVYVKDNGIGFEGRYAKDIFNVFKRAHSDKKFKGSGIGLANVRRIIDRHGGQVRAESDVGKGTAIYFTLPKVALHKPSREVLNDYQVFRNTGT